MLALPQETCFKNDFPQEHACRDFKNLCKSSGIKVKCYVSDCHANSRQEASYQQLWCAALTICYTNICGSVTESMIFTTGWAAVYPKAMFLTTNGAHGSTNNSVNAWGKEARLRVGFLTLWNTCEQESSTWHPERAEAWVSNTSSRRACGCWR